MKVKTAIKFTDTEIDHMIAVLNMLSDFADDNEDTLASLNDLTDKTFENLMNLLCLDPEGEQAFHANGW